MRDSLKRITLLSRLSLYSAVILFVASTVYFFIPPALPASALQPIFREVSREPAVLNRSRTYLFGPSITLYKESVYALNGTLLKVSEIFSDFALEYFHEDIYVTPKATYGVFSKSAGTDTRILLNEPLGAYIKLQDSDPLKHAEYHLRTNISDVPLWKDTESGDLSLAIPVVTPHTSKLSDSSRHYFKDELTVDLSPLSVVHDSKLHFSVRFEDSEGTVLCGSLQECQKGASTLPLLSVNGATITVGNELYDAPTIDSASQVFLIVTMNGDTSYDPERVINAYEGSRRYFGELYRY